jgi:hypothetical protein
MPADELTPESFRQRPDVVRAVENPRSPRSVLNYMCGCDTAKPEIRDSLNQDETVRPLMTIWFQSGRALDAFCQPFAPVVRELKADPPSLIGEEWDSLEGTAAKVLLADQLSRSCFRGSAEAFSYDPIARDLMRALMAPQMIEDTLTLPAAILYLLALGPGAFGRCGGSGPCLRLCRSGHRGPSEFQIVCRAQQTGHRPAPPGSAKIRPLPATKRRV